MARLAMERHFRGELANVEALWLTIVEGNARGFWPAEAELVAARNDQSNGSV